MKGPRFMLIISDASREEYPDVPGCDKDGAVFLWDRQEQARVWTLSGKYAQAVCLEHKEFGMPFTQLEEWFNSLDNVSLQSEGLPATKEVFEP